MSQPQRPISEGSRPRRGGGAGELIQPPASRSVSRRCVLGAAIPGVVLLGVAFTLGTWILARGNDPFPVDAWWNALLAGWQWEPAVVLALALNVAGGTWVGIYLVPALCAVGLLLLRRLWAAAYFIVASIISAALVQVLKHLFARERPPDVTVVADFGSFPSGHVANAATIVTVLIVLFPRRWAVLAGAVWVVLMAWSRTYLHAHWLSDTLGGAMIGSAAALLVAAALTVPLLRDRVRLDRPHPATAPAGQR